MKESDWKVFKEIKDKALDTYCKNILDESKKIISKDDKSAHNRYLKLYKHIKEKDQIIARLFNGHSRSKAWSQLYNIRQEDLADESLLLKLSAEFLESTDPDRFD